MVALGAVYRLVPDIGQGYRSALTPPSRIVTAFTGRNDRSHSHIRPCRCTRLHARGRDSDRGDWIKWESGNSQTQSAGVLVHVRLGVLHALLGWLSLVDFSQIKPRCVQWLTQCRSVHDKPRTRMSQACTHPPCATSAGEVAKIQFTAGIALALA